MSATTRMDAGNNPLSPSDRNKMWRALLEASGQVYCPRADQPAIFSRAQGRPEDYANAYPPGSLKWMTRATPGEKQRYKEDLRLLQRLQQVAPYLATLLVQPLEPHIGEVAVKVLAEEFAAAHAYDHARMRGRGQP